MYDHRWNETIFNKLALLYDTDVTFDISICLYGDFNKNLKKVWLAQGYSNKWVYLKVKSKRNPNCQTFRV